LSRQKVILLLVALGLVVVVVITFLVLPKHYAAGQRVGQTIVFWNDHDAFLFLALNTSGRSRNVLQEKLASSKYVYLNLFLGGYQDFDKQEVVAYHLTRSGQLDRFALPEHTNLYGTWGLADGKLQLVPASGVRDWTGMRWDGEKFVPVPAAPPQPTNPAPSAKLSADDLDEEDGGSRGYMDEASRTVFKQAGWHYKFLTGYEASGGEATLPIELGPNTFNLTVESTPINRDMSSQFDFMTFGARGVRLSGDHLAGGPQVLWTQSGWQTLTKSEYEQMTKRYGSGRVSSLPSWMWLAAIVVAVFWRFGHWASLLFSVTSLKSRILGNMATSYSFPPATPAQFPMLDVASLDRYTREFEAMGFSRLLDFSLVSNSTTGHPSFCRLFAHTRYHCWAEASQVFPRNKTAMPLKCSVLSCLQNGWTLSFSDRKPQPASSLIRRGKALSVGMPESTTAELLQGFLKMREQVCLDLGISPVNDDSLEAYIARAQRTAAEMREAVTKKNFAKGIPEIYLRKLALLKTKPEYVWLGDYPKETEQRKQGFNTFAPTSR
jgi:hypothetical protein